MDFISALDIAQKYKSLLAPHCERIEIAGSIRRKKQIIGDIEIVAIPLPYEIGLFESGIAKVVNQLKKNKRRAPVQVHSAVLPEGIKLDLFFAEKGNWGLIYAIRTGSAEYSHQVLASTWSKQGYESKNGYLTKNGKEIAILEEEHLFQLLNLPFVKPEKR